VRRRCCCSSVSENSTIRLYHGIGGAMGIGRDSGNGSADSSSAERRPLSGLQLGGLWLRLKPSRCGSVHGGVGNPALPKSIRVGGARGKQIPRWPEDGLYADDNRGGSTSAAESLKGQRGDACAAAHGAENQIGKGPDQER
jgi:hypothetical protein